jgi:hypothetical protein
LGSILFTRARVELSGGAGDSLRQYAGLFVDEDSHASMFSTKIEIDNRGSQSSILDSRSSRYYFFTAVTIFSAASAIVSAEMTGRPEAARIFLPNSTLVPCMRTTKGT